MSRYMQILFTLITVLNQCCYGLWWIWQGSLSRCVRNDRFFAL